MPDAIEFQEEPGAIDFLSDEDVVKAGVELPQAATSLLMGTMEKAAPAGELGQQRAALARIPTLPPMERAPTPPGAEVEGGVSPVQGIARAGGELARTVGQVVNPMTFMPEEAVPKPFVISPEGIRQMTTQEVRARSPLYSPDVPLLPVRGTQLQPGGSDAERQLASLSTLDNIALIAGGAESQVIGMAMLADMAPQAYKAVKDIARSDMDPDQKRDQINSLVMPLAIGLRHMRPEVTPEAEAMRRFAPPPQTMETAEQMRPLPLTGAAIPGRPRGAFPTMPAVAGREVLGPPAPVRPEVPATPPEAERGMSVIEEIRRRNLRTNKQIREAFPDYAGEVADLRRLAWGGAPDTGVRVAPTIPRPTPMPELGITPPPQGPPAPTVQEAGAMESMRQARELEDQRARQQSAIAQQIITWERELEFAQNRGDQRAVDQASQKLLDLRKQYEGPPAPSRQIAPKPPIPRAPGAKFRPEVPGTPAEPREDVISEIRRRNLRTREQILTAFPEMRQQEGAREKAAALRDQAWGKQPPGEPPAAPPAAPPPEPPPTQPPGPPPAGPAPSITPPPTAGEGAPVEPFTGGRNSQQPGESLPSWENRMGWNTEGLDVQYFGWNKDGTAQSVRVRPKGSTNWVTFDLKVGDDLPTKLEEAQKASGEQQRKAVKAASQRMDSDLLRAKIADPNVSEDAKQVYREILAEREGPTVPEVASMGPAGAGGKDPFGNPLGTKYHATPEDWAKWQELQARIEKAKAAKDFNAMPAFGKEVEAIKKKYAGSIPMPPKEPVAPKAAAATLTPDDLQPALLVNGKPVTGGVNHEEIHKNASAAATTDEEHAALFEALADDSKHVFVDKAGNVYTREQAAKALGEKDPLQSARLRELQQKGTLESKTEQGEGGVTRLTYSLGGKKVGEARLMGTTIGDIEVTEAQRRKGYGRQIIADLVKRGGKTAIAGSEAGAALLKSAGFREDSPGHFTIEPEAPPAAPAGIEGTVIAGKTLAEWEAVKDASDLPKPSKDDPDNKRRAILAKWLAVPNQPSRILQALANKKRTREIHAPPPAAVSPVAPAEVAAPETVAIPGIKSNPIGAVEGIPVYSGQQARKELTDRFGLPNAIGKDATSPFGGPGVYFVDDAAGGKVVAYVKLGSGPIKPTEAAAPVAPAGKELPAPTTPAAPPAAEPPAGPEAAPVTPAPETQLDDNFKKLLAEVKGASGSLSALSALQTLFDKALREEQITQKQHVYLTDRLSERLKSIAEKSPRKPFEEGQPQEGPVPPRTPPTGKGQLPEVAPTEKKVVQAVKAATLPTEEDVKQFLSVPEPDVTEQKEAAKFAVRQMTELQKQRDEKLKARKEVEKLVLGTRGYSRGRIKSGAKKSDIAKYQDLGNEIRTLEGQIEGIRRASAKDTLAAELAGEARRVNDTNASLLDRLASRKRMFAAAGERVPDELAKAIQALSQEEVRKRYPDATKQELEELGREVERSAMLHTPLDKEFELNPVFRGLYRQRRNELESAAFGANVPSTEFSKELNDRIARYTTQGRSPEWYGKPVDEKLSTAELESIKAQIAEETDKIRRNAAELEAKRQAEEAAEKAKETQLMAEAQKVADSLPHTGRKGAPSADSVRLELTRRVKGAIDETIAKSGVKLNRREDGSYIAETGDGTIASTGDIEETKLKSGKSNYRVTAYRFNNQKRKVSATVPTLEEAEWVIKAAAAEAPGRAIIGVPGDGVYTLNRTGMGLLETWAQARNLDTAANIKTPVTGGGAVEKPPGIPKTAGDWNETKEYYGLGPHDKIAEYSPELKNLAESAALKLDMDPSDVTTFDIDRYLKQKAQGEQSKGPGAAAEAEFAERPPDPEVLGLSAGNPVYNRIERGFRNLFSGLSQLGKRKATKQDFMQWINAADNMPRQAGLEAGNSLRERATTPQQQAVTALMQAFKMSGMGLEPDRVAEMEFGGNPTGWLRTVVADMETKAQEFLGRNLKLEAQAAIDMRNAARYALDHFNELLPLAELAKRKFDLQHARLANAGVDVNYENWYVPQRHELDLFSGQDRPVVLGHSRGAGAATGFKKAKTYPNYAEAIENGFVPRSLAIGDLLEHYVATTEKVLTYKGLFNSLGEVMDPVDNNPLATKIPRRVIERPDGTTDIQEHVPLGYVAMEVGPGMRLAIHRGYERLIRALTSSSQLSESAVVGTLQDMAAIEKHMMLALDTFHASRTLQAELALTHAASLPGTERLARGLALVELSPQDLDQAVRNGRITQEIADWIRTPSPVEVGGRQVSLSPRNIFRLGLQSGLNITRFADVMYRDWLREVPVLGTVNRWVFDKMTRSAMSQAFIAEFVRNAKANPGMNAKRVALKTASDINVMFGNLQKESIFRNPSMRAINNIVFLAPQWVESLARREGRFAGQIGETIVRAARGEGVALGTVGRGIGTGLAAYFVGTQLANLMTRGHLTFQNKEEGHKLDAWLPIGPHGMFVSPLSVFGEVTHDILRFAETKPDYFQVATQIASNKLGNLGRFLEVVATGRDPLSGEKVVGTARRAIKAATQLVPIPITASGAIRAAASMTGIVQPPAPGALPRQIMGSLGVKTEPAPSPGQQIRQKAQRWALSHGGKIQADAERRLKEDFGPSDYSNLRASLNRNDLEGARRAYQELRQAGKTPTTIRQTMEHPHPFTGSAANEAQFQRALTPEEKELYRQAVAERRELARRFHHMLQQTK